MKLSKFSNILRIIFLKIIETIEKHLAANTDLMQKDGLGQTLFTSLKFVVMEQVDGMVDEAVTFTKNQVNELAHLIVKKLSSVLAFVVSMLVLLALVLLCLTFFSIGLCLFLGDIMGNHYYGFLIVGGLFFVIILFVHYRGRNALNNKINRDLNQLID